MLARLKERLARSRRPAGIEDPFDPRTLSRLDRAKLRVRRASGARTGETPVRGPAQASGIELESFKSYTPGDDIRYVDWIMLGRLDQLVTRWFVPERQIPIHVFLDASASMSEPPGDGKFAFALRVAAALAYVALNHSDPVRIAAFRKEGDRLLFEETRGIRHRGRLAELRPFLSSVSAGGETALVEGVTRYLERHPEKGIAFLISDFLVARETYEEALARLRARSLEVRVIHVLGRHEEELTGLSGRLRIRDVESGSTRDVMVSERDRREYRRAFAQRVEALRDFSRRRGFGHAVARTAAGVEHFLTSTLAQEGLLQFR